MPAGGFTRRFMPGPTSPSSIATRIPSRRATSTRREKTASRFWPAAEGQRWVSADVHVHMNYGGHYRNTPAHVALQAQAEDVGIIYNLLVNKEQRVPDISYSGRGVDPASTTDALVVHSQEFHTSYWGHLGILGPHGPMLLPGYAGYPNTAAASLYPTNADVADLGHAEGALIG